MDQVKAVVKVETGVMDKATAEVLVARNTKVAVKTKEIPNSDRIRGLIQWSIHIWQNYHHDKKCGLSRA